MKARLAVVAFVVTVAGCSSAPVVVMPEQDLRTLCDEHITACEATRDRAVCRAAMACVAGATKAEVCAIDLDECRRQGRVDVAECLWRAQACERERDRYKEQRWWFGGGGFAMGALLGLLLLLL